MSIPLYEAKARARKIARVVRERAHIAGGDTAAMRLAAHAFPVACTADTKCVSGFFPYQSEIDTQVILGKLAGEGWTTCLPIVTGKAEPLIFRRWLPGEPLGEGTWGISVPAELSPLVVPDVLLVPMLAFDREGFRLGYGGGFYDRTLEKLRKQKRVVAIGVAYAAQEVDAVARDAHDQPLDYVMTEKEVFRCG